MANNSYFWITNQDKFMKIKLILIVILTIKLITTVVSASAQDGTLDSTFNFDGMVVTDFNYASYSKAIATQSDGKIIGIGGNNNDSTYVRSMMIVRYLTNGDIDSTFGTSGKVFRDLGSLTLFIKDGIIQNDGKILVVGYASNPLNSFDDQFLLSRFNSDGSIDSTFGIDGIVLTYHSHNEILNSVVQQNDGKIVVAGSTANAGYTAFAVARYNIDGSIDSTFNFNGIAMLQLGNFGNYAVDVALQNDGKIVTLGIFEGFCNGDGRYIGNLTSGGYLEVRALAIQNDGKIVAAGRGMPSNLNSQALLLLRLNSNGIIDSTFGNNGIVWTDYDAQIGDLTTAITIQNDNKILLIGDVFNGVYHGQAAIIRYNCDILTEHEEYELPNDNYTFYPNPFAEKINIKSTIDISSEVTIYDVSSRILVKQKFNGSTNIDMNNFEAGLYIYAIMKEDELVQKGKLIKN